MTILSHARSMRYEVGSNLKGTQQAATWTLLLPTLDVRSAAVVGRPTPAEVATLVGLTGRPPINLADAKAALDLVFVARGGRRQILSDAGRQALEDRLGPSGAVYLDGRGGQPSLGDVAARHPRRYDVWPSVGTARAFIPSGDEATVARLVELRLLPPPGANSLRNRAIGRLAELGAVRRRAGRWAEVATGAGSSTAPPAWLGQIAREAGVDIGEFAWALVAPGDYPSQKVLAIMLDPADRAPRMVVKLGVHPAHAPRLANEAAALRRLAALDLPPGSVPALRFNGEHAGRHVVGQSWVPGVPFARATDVTPHSPQLAAAVAWLSSLAARTVDRRPAAELSLALRDLHDRFAAIHRLPAPEATFLQDQVRAVERHPGTLPTVMQHGDPGTWNLLVDDGTVAFLDWESAEVNGMPLWDLFHLQASFGALAVRRERLRRRLDATLLHLVDSTPLQARFADQVATMADRIELPRTMIEPLFFLAWMHRSLKEATRRTDATLQRGLYLRLLRSLIARRDTPPLRRLLGR